MIERFQRYFESLELLSTEALECSVEKLVQAEVRNTALVIAHLAEMSRRKTALERGYKSLFDYAVKRLNLSEGSVALRLQVANTSRRFPQILVALAENRISLSVAGLLAPHLTESNVDKLLSDCAGMTKRSVEEYLVGLKPRPVVTLRSGSNRVLPRRPPHLPSRSSPKRRPQRLFRRRRCRIRLRVRPRASFSRRPQGNTTSASPRQRSSRKSSRGSPRCSLSRTR